LENGLVCALVTLSLKKSSAFTLCRVPLQSYGTCVQAVCLHPDIGEGLGVIVQLDGGRECSCHRVPSVCVLISVDYFYSDLCSSGILRGTEW
jgi:hypothetical protein